MYSKYSFIRILNGILFGTLISIMIWGAMDRGFYSSFQKIPWQFNELFYDNWFLRITTIIISSGSGAILAGIISRKNGIIAGLISVMLPVLFWLYCFYCLLNHQFNLNIPLFSQNGNYNNFIPQSTSSIMLIFAAIINIIVGFIGGAIGENIGKEYSMKFDSIKHSLLGIKWYNYLWYLVILYIILLLNFINANSYLDMMKNLYPYLHSSNSTIINRILIGIIMIIALVSLLLLIISIAGSYRILANDKKSKKEKISQLILFIIILPLISVGMVFLSDYIYSVIHY